MQYYGFLGLEGLWYGKCWVKFTLFTHPQSSKKTCGSYSFSEGQNGGLIRIWKSLPIVFKLNEGLIRIRVLFEVGSLSRIYGSFVWWFKNSITHHCTID